MSCQETQQSFRLISIEPLERLEVEVRKVAADHGFSLKSEDATTQIAPFCGHSYFSQKMALADCTFDLDIFAQVEKCLAAIEELADANLADGYVEFV
jgi:hypothetical protein